MVEIHRKSQADYKEARSSKHPEFAKAWQHFEKLEKQILTAKDKKRDARMRAGSRDPSHPLIIKANNALNALISEKKTHYDDVANLLSLNVNLKHIQYRLGHSSIKTTMDTYGKILEKDKDEVARKIEQWDLQMES